MHSFFSPLFRQSFQSKIPTQRNHSLSASARSTEHLCWLPAKSNICATATRLGCSPKVIVQNVAKGQFLTSTVITGEGTNVKVVEDFCYLGSYLPRTGTCDKECKTRLEKRQVFMGRPVNIWKSKNISFEVKIRL